MTKRAESCTLMMEKAQIPEMWKATKVITISQSDLCNGVMTPLHKRGPVLDPNKNGAIC